VRVEAVREVIAARLRLRSNGPKATVYGVHGAMAVVRATAALLFT
jgi:hypothetical protein